MKKLIMMLATLVMSFAFAVSVMAAPSPDDENYEDNTKQETIDEKTQFDDDEFYNDNTGTKTNSNSSSSTTTSSTSTSASPKTGDQGAPVTLVYASLAAAAFAVYAAKRVKEQY